MARQLDETERLHLQRRTLWVLAVSVALATAAAAAAFAAAAVLGEELTGSEVLGSLAAASLTIGTAAGAIPLARLMDSRGRRPGFQLGLWVAGGGAALVFLAAVLEFYPALLLGAVAIGVGNAVAFAARFAATDLATPDEHGRAIGFVVWAATAGAIFGPAAGLSGAGFVAEALSLPRIAGVYVFVGVCLVLAAQVVTRFLHPDPLLAAREASTEPSNSTRPSIIEGWRALAAAPLAQIGAGALVMAHVVMIAIMTVTPLHLHDGNSGLTLIGFVISVHILGMYGLSPVVGWMTDRMGALRTIAIGGCILVGAAELAAASSPHEHAQIFAALFLLGLGWNCALVAGSSLVATWVDPDRRVAAQGFTDLTMNALGASAGVIAGLVLGLQSFGALSHLGAIASLVVIGAAILGSRARGARPRVAPS